MTRFEHCTVTVNATSFVGSVGERRMLSQFPKLPQLRELESEGWELVTVSRLDVGNDAYLTLFFKRPGARAGRRALEASSPSGGTGGDQGVREDPS